MGKYRILAFDGGGVKGIVSAIFLQRLARKFPTLIQQTDLVVGTSSGSFIALGLANGDSPKKIVQLFSQENLAFVFANPRDNELQPKYDNANLIQALNKAFPTNPRLSRLKKRVVVPSFEVIGPNSGMWRPIFFNNFRDSATRNLRVVNAALSSSAAPTFFPSYRHRIDGEAVDVNPSIPGITFAVQKARRKLDEIVLLSIGAGFNPFRITQDTSTWGELQWLGIADYAPGPNEPTTPLISILTDGVVLSDVLFSSQLLGNRFHRLNVNLGSQVIPLDDVAAVPELQKIAEHHPLDATEAFIRKEWLPHARSGQHQARK